MRALSVVVAVLLTSCATGSQPVATTATPATTAPPAPVTSVTPPVEPLDIEMTDCATPQITFSPLCETYQLIEDWHVDRPIDPEALARVALEGLLAYETTETEEPPRTLICAIPHRAFEELCVSLALRVQESSIPIGPAIESAVAAMTDTGLDAFTWYIPPDQAGAFRSNGVVGGVGVLLDANDAAGSRCARVNDVCQLTIVFVLEDNPGAEAGLETGDVIVAIDGDEIEGLGFVEAGSLIAGDETGTVQLTVERGGQSLEFSIERSALTVPTVVARLPRHNVGYIRIPDFESDIPELVLDGLLSIDAEPYSTLVVDLRDNPGGFVDSAVAVISEFVDEGPVLVEIDGDNTEQYVYEAIPGGLAIDKRLIVLVNGGTASAAEVMAAALRDRRGAVVLGEPTFGKDTIQIVFDLNNGGELHLAVSRWLSPDRVSVVDGGLDPDFEVRLPADMSIDDLVDIALDNS